MRCAVIGLGEAGTRYATALVQGGHEVRGYDPAQVGTPAGVHRVDSLRSAVTGGEFVMVLTGAAVAPVVAEEAAPHLLAGACYADFTSAAPQTKREVEALVGARTRVADVAILGPVVKLGARTPLMASGPGAPAVAGTMTPLGAGVDVVDAPVGNAMAHKLVRSVFMKGLAAATYEAVQAGRAEGFEEWIRDQIAAELAGDGHSTIDRFLNGQRLHAARRAHEMGSAVAHLASLGTSSYVADAAHGLLADLAAGSHVSPGRAADRQTDVR